MASSSIIYTKQSSFANGEVSADMWGRDDYAKYFVSAKTLENFIPLPYGGAQNRPGTKFITEVKDSSKKVKLLPFQFSVEQAYIIEAGENYFRYYKDGGQIINGSTIVETTTTYGENYLFNLKTAQSADTLYLCNSNYKPKTLTRTSHYNWTLTNFDFKGGPFRDQNTTTTRLTPSATTGTITVTASSGVFTSNMVGGLLKISHDIYGQSAHFSGSAENTTAVVKVNGDWDLQITDPYAATFTIQISNDNGTTWETLKTYSCTDSSSAIQDSGNIDHYALLRIYSTASTDGWGSYTLSSTAFANNGYATITAYTNATTVTATVYENGNKYIWGIASTGSTADWSIGAWNEEYGYPACAKFYQNRLGFAGSTKDPLTLWMSQTGDYPNFIVNSPTEDSDAITAPLVSEGVNSIRSMVSISNMMAFTAGGTWKIGTGSESTSLAPTTVRALQQGYIGVSNLNPIVIGSRILYCQEMGSTIRDISYQLADDVYKGDDMTMLSRHLFKNYSIVDWAFQQEPDGIIWAIRSDGVLLSFTYNKEQDVYAWSRHITDGEYESVAAIPGDGYTEIYFVVRREINGVYKRYIEKLVPRMVSTDPRDQFFVDCGLSLDNPITITGATKTNPVVITATAHGLSNGNYVDISDVKGMTELNGMRYKVANKTTDTFQLINMDDDTNIDGTGYTAYKSSGYVRKCVITVSGLNHLEGKTVTILADGSVNTTQVVSGGSITLNDYASRVHVGLGYECNLETLNIDFPMNNGTIQGRTKKICNVTIRFENTYGGYVGINGDNNLEVIEQTLATIMGKPGDLVTGDKKVSPYADFETNATVYIRQPDPLPMTVLAIMSEVEVGA
jgi:hypothetical protein